MWVSRAKASVVFPAQFLLIGATNPCPCGEGTAPGACRCTDAARWRYARRLSGPLLDRFDLRVGVDRPAVEELLGAMPAEATAPVAVRVAAAREVARRRGFRCNAELPADRLDQLAPLTAPAVRVLERELRDGRISARGLHRIRRVARTLADLGSAPDLVDDIHVCGALELRSLNVQPHAVAS